MFNPLRRKSKDTLKNRLELVLAYDRAKIEPGKIDALRSDLMQVLDRYFPSGDGKPNLEVEQRDGKICLAVQVPLLTPRA